MEISKLEAISVFKDPEAVEILSTIHDKMF
jgi:hypothetical protein